MTTATADPPTGRTDPADFFAVGANGKPSFKPSRAVSALRSERRFATGGGRLFGFTGGVYRENENYVRQWCAERLGEDWSRNRRDEICSLLRDTSPVLDERPPLDVINTPSGLVDIATGKLGPHDPDLLSPVQIGAPYKPDADCPRINQFLETTLPEDVRQVAIELVAYTATPDTSLQLGVMALGGGANGKSTFMGTLTSFLGPANVSAIALQRLEEDRFALAQLQGKLANVFQDLDQKSLRGSSIFKSVVSGDLLTAEHKFGHPFAIQPYARLIFSANTAPHTSDSSEGFFRRWLTIPFDRKFNGADRDPHLLRKLTTADELAGLLNLALPALTDLRARGSFSPSDTITKAADDFRVSVDSVAGFLDETCTITADGQTPKPRLTAAYRNWCQTNGRGALSTQRFNERLQALVPTLTDITTRGLRQWRGIALHDDTHA